MIKARVNNFNVITAIKKMMSAQKLLKHNNIRRFCYRNVIPLYKLIIISHTNNIMIENKYEYSGGLNHSYLLSKGLILI